MSLQSAPNHLTEEFLYQYLDGALSPGEETGAEQHLQRCPACQAQLQEIRILFNALTDLPEIPLTIDLAPSIVNTLQAQERFWLSGRWLAVLQLATAAAVLVLSWPLLAVQAAKLPLPALQFELWFIELQENLVTPWAFWSHAAIDTLAQSLALIQGPVPTIFQELSLWPWIIGIGLLWLAVNGFLLRPGGIRALAHHPNGSASG